MSDRNEVVNMFPTHVEVKATMLKLEKDPCMQLTIQLDPESARKLASIQQRTNQDHDTIVRQVLDLYHQQLQSTQRWNRTIDSGGVPELVKKSIAA